MSDLGDLLELLHAGGAGDRTVQATIRTWHDTARARDAFLAASEEAGAAVFTAYAESDEPEPDDYETTTRLWVAPPDRVREESGEQIAVMRGGLWWRYEPQVGAESNEDSPEVGTSVGDEYAHLFDPGSLLGALVLTPLGDAEHRGRAVVRARATQRPTADEDAAWTLHGLGFGGDAWELWIDAEHGVLLRVDALRDGAVFSRTEVLDLAVGEPIDDDVFVFVTPPGEEVQPVEGPRLHHRLSIDKVEARAPFTVFVPEELGEDWELDLLFSEGSERRGEAAWVQVLVRSTDRHWSVAIRQVAAGCGGEDLMFVHDADRAPWRTERHGDREMKIREPHEEWAPAIVRLLLDGTHLELTSNDVGSDRLIELARRLVPAPDASPGWD